MLSEMERTTRSKAGVRKWYANNREDYNALRRKRYAENQATREAAQDRAASYRYRVRGGDVDILANTHTRMLLGKEVVVHTSGQVAVMLGRTPQMLRNWERAELIPPSIFEDTIRYYTLRQSQLLRTLLNLVQKNGGSWEGAAVKKRIAHTFGKW